MRKIYLLLFALITTSVAHAQYLSKITDINYYGYNGLNPSELTVFKDKLYFLGTDDPQYVDKLMSSNGIDDAGVTTIKQIDSVKQYPALANLTVLNSLLLFNNQRQLWKSDGTTNGTVMLKDSLYITTYPNFSYPNIAVLGNNAYFAADNVLPAHVQLWKTDGTPAGTKLVKTINAGGSAGISNMFVYNGKLYFSATDGTHGTQLWTSDGTGGGTVQFEIINTTGDAYPSDFFVFNNKLYFNADDGVNGTQLWVTDGTDNGTKRISSINSNPSYGFNPYLFTPLNNQLFFKGYDGFGTQLYVMDGSTQAVSLVKANYSPINGSRGFNPTSLAVHSNMLYISGYDSITDKQQLFISDGTLNGTTQLTFITKGFGFDPANFYSFKSRLVMTGNDTITTYDQVWVTDGTTTGLTCPAQPRTAGSYPLYPIQKWVPYHDALYFRGAYQYFADYQLCRYSETFQGIKNIAEPAMDVYPNPSNNRFTIVLPQTDDKRTIEIYNALGGLVLQQTATVIVNTVDISAAPAGLYILKLSSNGVIVGSRKLVKE